MGFCGLCDSLKHISWGESFPLEKKASPGRSNEENASLLAWCAL